MTFDPWRDGHLRCENLGINPHQMGFIRCLRRAKWKVADRRYCTQHAKRYEGKREPFPADAPSGVARPE